MTSFNHKIHEEFSPKAIEPQNDTVLRSSNQKFKEFKDLKSKLDEA